jgi:hypothetical protein
MKYNVVAQPIYTIKVTGVEADSPEEAMQKVEVAINWNSLISAGRHHNMCIEYVDFAEEFDAFIVDEVGDTEFNRTVVFNSLGERV